MACLVDAKGPAGRRYADPAMLFPALAPLIPGMAMTAMYDRDAIARAVAGLPEIMTLHAHASGDPKAASQVMRGGVRFRSSRVQETSSTCGTRR